MKWIVGSDEAGYGTWAGSLVIAAVAVPETWRDPKVTDSKKLSDDARESAVARYKDLVLWSLQVVTSKVIDDLGVYNCCIQAHVRAHHALALKLEQQGVDPLDIEHIADGLENAKQRLITPDGTRITPMAKADLKIPAVSLASCFAKVTQCHHMDELHKLHPDFGFNSHRGYGVPAHKAALAKYGVLDVHRKSYAPIKNHGYLVDMTGKGRPTLEEILEAVEAEQSDPV